MAENYIDLKFIADTTQLEKAGAVADRLETRINKLVAQEAKGRITTQQYSDSIRRMATEMQKAAGGTIQARNAVLQYSRDTYQAAESMRQMAAAAQMSQKAMHQKGVVTQQVGYQVGDLLVQVQSGTNFFVAFGQQATQLVGVLGMLNPRLIGLSAGLGIAIPLVTALAAMMTRSSSSTKDAEKELRSYSSAAQTASEKIAQLRLEEEARVDNQRDTTSYLLKQGVIQAQLELQLAKEAMNTSMEETGVLQVQIDKAQKQLQIRQELLDNYNKELETAEARKKQEEQIEKAQDRAKERLEAYIETMAQYFRDVRAGYQAVAESQTTITSETEAYIQKMSDLFKKSQELREELGDAAFEMIRMGNIDIEKPITLAAIAASNLAANLKLALAQQLGLISSVQYGMMEGSEGAQRLRKYGGRGTTSTKDPIFGDTGKSIFDKGRTGGGRGKSPAEQLEEYMAAQENLVELQTRQIGLSEEQARIEELKNKYVLAGIEPNMQRIQALAAEEEQLRKTTEAEQKRKSMMETIEGHITNGFMAMIDGSSSVEDAFKGMLRNILLEIYRQQVAEPIAKGIGGFLSGLFADGAAFRGGRVTPFANGGVVSGPTMFPMTNGTGLMGEAGPEAIMPLKRGPNGKLGVEASGGQQVVVNQSFNFAANGDESVKKIIAQAAPQIAQMTQKQIMDSRRRGGQMKAAFS